MVFPGLSFAQDQHYESRFLHVLATFKNRYDFPGATAAFVFDTGESGSVAIGLSDIEAQKPMSKQTRMLTASIGKTFVGALILSLEREGKIARQEYLSEYLADKAWFSRLPNHADITVNHLLRHTSGLADHVYMEAFTTEFAERFRNDSEMFTPEELIALLFGSEPLADAGQVWSYSDTGYLLLGLAIEAATNREYYDLVRERFIEPLQLIHMEPSDHRQLQQLAAGYVTADNAFGLPAKTINSEGELLWNPGIEWTGGGFSSTSEDLARWGSALFSGNAMQFDYLNELLDGIPIDANATNIEYAAGIAKHSGGEFGPVYGHGGWIPGYSSSLRYYADRGVAIAFQINTDIGIIDDSANFVAKLEYEFARALFLEAE